MNIDIVEIMSGEEEELLWVTLGFTSEIEENDVIHIVCAKTIDQQDIDLGMDKIYLERFDQAYSCYGGAKNIIVNNSNIGIEFTEKGMKSIKLGSKVDFINKKIGSEYVTAVSILKKMSSLKCGCVVSCAYRDRDGHR